MSIDRIKSIFRAVNTCEAWSLQLLKITNSKRNGTGYLTREIILAPEGRLFSFISEVSERYIDAQKGEINKYNDVRNYDGTMIDKTVYVLDKDSELVCDEFQLLLGAIANPDVEIDPLAMNAQAYIINGMITLNDVQCAVKFVSMQKPVTNLKHKFMRANGTFTEIDDKVISLKSTVDVIIFENKIYMLTLAGENLFNMERAYKAICSSKIEDVKEANIISDENVFENVASTGHNPRKFVGFSETRLEKLKNANTRKKVSKQFEIPLNGNEFDTSTPEVAERLVKILCNRGMMDPFEDNAVEVDGSKKWE